MEKISGRLLLRQPDNTALSVKVPVLMALQASRQVRYAHSKRHSSYSSTSATSSIPTDTRPSELLVTKKSAPLSCLPLSSIIRSYLITTISSRPLLLTPSLGVLNYLAYSKSRFFNPDANPILRYVLKKTFYAQFCAGETPAEVRSSVVALKKLGYAGVILGYGREVVMDEEEARSLGTSMNTESAVNEEEKCMEEIETWKAGTLQTVRLADDRDFVALKFTGAGSEAFRLLAGKEMMSERLEREVVEICEVARGSGVRLLFDAEQAAVQDGIDLWTLEFMKRYNGDGRALVYGTYQAYRRSTPTTLARHLEVAKREGFTLGVKLVRGAYLGSDPRELFWGRKEETDRVYDGIAESLIRRRSGEVMKSASGGGDELLPQVDLVLASHNRNTIEKARNLRSKQVEEGEKRIRLVFGQLQGMADEISCELVQARKNVIEEKDEAVDRPKAYKYLVWGTVGECTKYLLRRAQENRDAVLRTLDGRKAMGKELRRRLRRVLTSDRH